MAGKRAKTKKRVKLNKKQLSTIGVLILIIAVIFIIIMIFKPVNVGKINKESKAEYIERVANVTKYPDKKIVEFKNDYELIDNGIITTEIYEKLKNNDNIYNLTVAEYLRLGDISSKKRIENFLKMWYSMKGKKLDDLNIYCLIKFNEI